MVVLSIILVIYYTLFVFPVIITDYDYVVRSFVDIPHSFITSDWFFSTEAISVGGPDARKSFKKKQVVTWYTLGFFND